MGCDCIFVRSGKSNFKCVDIKTYFAQNYVSEDDVLKIKWPGNKKYMCYDRESMITWLDKGTDMRDGNGRFIYRLVFNSIDQDSYDLIRMENYDRFDAKETNFHVQGNRGTPVHWLKPRGERKIGPVYPRSLNRKLLQMVDSEDDVDVDAVKRLLDQGADVKAKDKKGRTALMHAAENGHTEVMKLLVNHGAVVNTVDELGNTPIKWVVNDLDTVKFLIKNGADVDRANKNGFTLLMAAAQRGATDVVKFLIQRGADVTAKTSGGDTALTSMFDDRNENVEIAKLLIKNGADVNAKENYFGHSPLIMSAKFGDTEIANLLIKNGADLNAKDNDGTNALMHAIEKGHTDVVKLLVEKMMGKPLS